tara:strand:- start:344 stop:1243 length:900 start_codon:yes stop_codon:yes gene_type:complete
MTKAESLIDSILARCASSDHKPTIDDPIFSELENSISVKGDYIEKLNQLLLNDHICELLWDDSYPMSNFNQRSDDWENLHPISEIFLAFRPAQDEIIAKKDSKSIAARLFSIWFSTYEHRGDTKQYRKQYDSLAGLLLDEYSSVRAHAVENLSHTVSNEAIVNEIKIFFYADFGTWDHYVAEWLFGWINDLINTANEWYLEDNEDSIEQIASALEQDDRIENGWGWAEIAISLRQDSEFLARIESIKEKFIHGYTFLCTCGTNSNSYHGIWVPNYECRECKSLKCSRCMDEGKICKSCL